MSNAKLNNSKLKKLRSMSIEEVAKAYEEAKEFIRMCEQELGKVFGLSSINNMNQGVVNTQVNSISNKAGSKELAYEPPVFGGSMAEIGNYVPIGDDMNMSPFVDYGIQDAYIHSLGDDNSTHVSPIPVSRSNDMIPNESNVVIDVEEGDDVFNSIEEELKEFLTRQQSMSDN